MQAERARLIVQGIPMHPDPLRAAFVSGTSARTTASHIKNALSWTARGATVVVLILCGVIWLEGKETARNIDKLASDVVETMGDAPNLEQRQPLNSTLDRRIEEINALNAVANDEIQSVADWRAATPMTQVVRAEYWLRAAARGNSDKVSDATYRMVANDIADCVNALTRREVGIDDLPAVTFGARCIARLAG